MLSPAHEKISPKRTPAIHIALFASVVLTFLVPASAAGAADAGVVPPTSAANAAAAVEQVAETAANVVPVERAEAPAPSPEPQPAETPRVASAPDSIRQSVVSAVHEPAAAASTNLPTSTRSAARSATSVVDSVSTQTTSVASPKTGPGATIVPAISRQVGALDEDVRRSSEAVGEDIRQDLSGTVAEVRRGVAEKTTGLSAQLTPRPGGTLLAPALPNFNMASTAVELPSAGLLPTSEDFAQASPASFLESRPAGFFSNWNPIASGGYTANPLTLGELERVEKVEAARNHPGTLSLTPVSGGSAGFDAADSRGSMPPDFPLPAPRLPDAVASGSGDAFFVPFAALLALLALVAPASMRRPRETPDFRASTPFVCALERPG